MMAEAERTGAGVGAGGGAGAKGGKEEKSKGRRGKKKAPSVDILLLGGSKAGKSLLRRHLDCLEAGTKLTDMATIATTGVEGALTTIVKRAGPKNKVVARHDMVIREAGSSMARMWYSYYGDCHGILYVVDSTNTAQMASATANLFAAMRDERNEGVPVAIMLNKCDATNRMSATLFKSLIRFDDLVASASAPVVVLEASAASGQGLGDVIDWMIAAKTGKLEG